MFQLSLASLYVRLIMVTLVAILPAMGVALYSGLEQRRAAEVNAQATALQLAQLAASSQQQLIESARQLLVVLTQLPQMRQANPESCQVLFGDMVEKYPYYTDLGVITLDGEWVCWADPANRPGLAAEADWFQKALQSRDFAVGNYEFETGGSSTGRAIIHLAYPILDDANRPNSFAVLALDLAWLSQFVAEVALPAGAAFTIVDGQGIILARQPDPNEWVGKAAPEAPLIAAILSERGQGTARVMGLNGVPRLFAFVPLGRAYPTADAYVAVGIPESVAFGEADQTLARNLLGSGLSAVVSFGAAWILGELLIMRPTQSLMRATRRLAAGDYSVRTEVKGMDGEFGELARAFNEMAEALQTEKIEGECLFREVQRLARTDELTGLHNRRYFFELAERELKRYRRFGHPLSALMLDVDHFKRVNDTYGHAVGDEVLRAVGEQCAVNSRAIDILGRYGGEEFALLLPEADQEAAREIGERLVLSIRKSPIPAQQGPIFITISVGVASATEATSDVASLLNAADKALYAAKQTGRNRVALAISV